MPDDHPNPPSEQSEPLANRQALPDGGVDSTFVNPATPVEDTAPADGPRPADGPL